MLNSRGAKPNNFFLPKKYKKSTFPHPVFLSSLSRVVYCFLTVSRSVAQNVFNASQGVRDIGFLSWTPLTIFPPQVSCMKQGYIAWLPPIAYHLICHLFLEPLVTFVSLPHSVLQSGIKEVEPQLHGCLFCFTVSGYLSHRLRQWSHFKVITVRACVLHGVEDTNVQSVAWGLDWQALSYIYIYSPVSLCFIACLPLDCMKTFYFLSTGHWS